MLFIYEAIINAVTNKFARRYYHILHGLYLNQSISSAVLRMLYHVLLHHEPFHELYHGLHQDLILFRVWEPATVKHLKVFNVPHG